MSGFLSVRNVRFAAAAIAALAGLFAISLIQWPAWAVSLASGSPRLPWQVGGWSQVLVDAQGRIYLNVGGAEDKPIDADTLVQRTAAVLRNKPTTPVMVRGDSKADYGSVVGVMTLLQKAGAPSVGLVTESPEAKRR